MIWWVVGALVLSAVSTLGFAWVMKGAGQPPDDRPGGGRW